MSIIKIKELAKNTQSCCKVSGLVTEAATSWENETIKPYLDVLFNSFGIK